MESMNAEISPEVRAYLSALGRKKTPAKAASSRRNALVAAAARRKDPAQLPCVCGRCPANPKTTCPRGRLLRQRSRCALRDTSENPDTQTTTGQTTTGHAVVASCPDRENGTRCAVDEGQISLPSPSQFGEDGSSNSLN